MNSSTFTTEELRIAIPPLVKNHKGLTVNECGYDRGLCEFSLNDPIEVMVAEAKKGFVYVRIPGPGNTPRYRR